MRCLFFPIQCKGGDGDERDRAQRRIGFNPACGSLSDEDALSLTGSILPRQDAEAIRASLYQR
jgi:hypothetical protein